MWYNVYWIISLEEIWIKIKINGYLKNITDNTKEEFKIIGIRNKNKITYIKEETKHTINIISNNKVILLRENKEIKHTFIFVSNKEISTEYFLKSQNLSIDIDIKVISLKVEENIIDIEYIVKDSDNKYEYKIEMSDL